MSEGKSCCHTTACAGCAGVPRRDFLAGIGSAAVGLSFAGGVSGQVKDPVHQQPLRATLTVQPALL